MNEILDRVDNAIREAVEAAYEAGFTIYVPKPSVEGRKIGHVYVCKDPEGSFATIERPTHSWDPVYLSVPIAPSRHYGSGVIVDHDGTTEGIIRALEKAVLERNVTVRWVAKRGEAAPIVPNHGVKALTRHTNAKNPEDRHDVLRKAT